MVYIINANIMLIVFSNVLKIILKKYPFKLIPTHLCVYYSYEIKPYIFVKFDYYTIKL